MTAAHTRVWIAKPVPFEGFETWGWCLKTVLSQALVRKAQIQMDH